jgi:hypothetical protein
LDLRRLWTHDLVFDACENEIGSDERIGDDDPQILMVMSPLRAELRLGTVWSHPISLLVTEDLVIAGRKRALGRRADVQRWFRWHFPEYSVGLWRGAGPGYAVRMRHEDEGILSFVFKTPEEADALGRYFAEG